VALLGAGPAGLTAAYFLGRAGCAGVVFEAQPEAGGGLRYGVTEEALPRTLLEAEIAAATEAGAELRLRQAVAAGALAALRREYDVVLIAMGEMTAEQAADWGLPWAQRGLAVEEQAAVAGLPGVFAAGSAVAPSHHAARACGEGRVAAEAILRFLAGQNAAPPHAVNTHIGRMEPEEVARLLAEASPEGAVEASEAEGSFSPEEAVREARRCLRCDCRKLAACRLRQYATEYAANPGRFREERRPFALDTSHPQVAFESGKCISCGLCLQIAERVREPLGLAFVGRGFAMRTEVPFRETLAAGLQIAAAECVAACPTGALAWKDKEG
jgi:ferredoxin